MEHYVVQRNGVTQVYVTSWGCSHANTHEWNGPMDLGDAANWPSVIDYIYRWSPSHLLMGRGGRA